MSEDRVKRRLAAILAADVVGYSRLMSQDEERLFDRLKSVRRELFEPATRKYGGRIFKTTGDGAFVEFGSSVDAVRSAIDIQNALAERGRDEPEEERIFLRIGIGLADVIVEGSDLYGHGVNIAARMEGLSRPGGVCITDVVRDHVRGAVDAEFIDLGPQHVKNIPDPIRSFMIRLAGERDAPPDPSAAHTPAVPDKPSIAVLAFDNMSEDAEQSYFSDGISEDIITDLSKISDLHVTARNSSFVYRNTAVDIPEVARALGVRYVLEGSVRKAGNRVRVTAQLIDSFDGGHVWADRFDRDLTDIFEVQDELTREIVSALKIKLTGAERDRLDHKSTGSVDAYNVFLQARNCVWLHTRDGNIEGRRLLAQALALDPSYSAADALIGFTHVMDYVNGWTDTPEETLSKGLALARKAAEQDPDEPLAHFAHAVGLMWSRDHDGAAAATERCLEIEPNSAEGMMIKAHVQIFGGEPETAVETIETYMSHDPHYPELVLQFLAEAQISLHRFADAADTLRLRRERNPDAVSLYALMTSVYGHLGRIDEAQAAWKRLHELFPAFSLERRRRVLPFKNPDDFELRVEGMRKAGVVD